MSQANAVTWHILSVRDPRVGKGQLIKPYDKVTFTLNFGGLEKGNSKKNEMLTPNHSDVKGYLLCLDWRCVGKRVERDKSQRFRES